MLSNKVGILKVVVPWLVLLSSSCLLKSVSAAPGSKSSGSKPPKNMPYSSKVCPKCNGKGYMGRLTVIGRVIYPYTDPEPIEFQMDAYLGDPDIDVCNVVGWIPSYGWSGSAIAGDEEEIQSNSSNTYILTRVRDHVNADGLLNGCWSCTRRIADGTWVPDHTPPVSVAYRFKECHELLPEISSSFVLLPPHTGYFITYKFRPHCPGCMDRQKHACSNFSQSFNRWVQAWEREDPSANYEDPTGTTHSARFNAALAHWRAIDGEANITDTTHPKAP